MVCVAAGITGSETITANIPANVRAVIVESKTGNILMVSNRLHGCSRLYWLGEGMDARRLECGSICSSLSKILKGNQLLLPVWMDPLLLAS